jgi:hypothetical protein
VTDDRSRLDALQAQLRARRSVFHFAHAAVSLLVAVIAACTGAKYFWDYELDDLPTLSALVGVSGVLFIYGAVHWALGHRALKRELTLFDELKGLRQHLRLDDPSALLPR